MLKVNRAALAGTLAVGMAIAISSFTVVRAEHAQPAKGKKTVFPCSAGTACLTGSSTGPSTTGVEGTSASATGVVGTTGSTGGDSGIAGISSGTSGHGYGTYGRSSNGSGVYGSSSATNGIEGHSTAFGGSGVVGFQLNTGSSPGNGVTGESADATGSWVALFAEGLSTSTVPFVAVNNVTHDYCIINAAADLSCSGSITGNAIRTRHENGAGQHVLAYASESASAMIDDVGTGRMVAGIANVALDRAFASTIDRNSAYRVFVTPRGDTRGLYVSTTTPMGFQVREAQGGRSTVSFDYRIVARPMDAKNDHLPLAPATRVPGLGTASKTYAQH
jgi:hypothetical protein